MKYLLIATGIMITVITGCNPIGKKIDTIPCEEVYINSSVPVTLKKGDKIGIWFETSGVRPEEKNEEDNNEKEQESIPSVGINIQLKDQSVFHDKIRVLPVRPLINTSYDKKTDFLEKYETLALTYVATENGEYSVDTKLYNPAFGQDVSVIVRKK
jgi:hypothetical protein